MPNGSFGARGIAPHITPYIAVALAIGAALLAGCSSKDTGDAAPTVTVQVATAKIASIDRIVTADAIIFPRDQAAIVPKISAPVKAFYVDRGARVHAGQLLAELESQDLAGAYAENQGGYQEAQTNYDTAVQKAQQDLTLAKQQLDAAQKVFDSRQNLLKQGAVSAKDVEDARIALTQAQNQNELAQKQYDLKRAQAQLAAAKGKAANAEAQLNYAKITSPIDGVVTDRPLYAGETASAGSPILTVMDIAQVVAKAHIAQEQAAALKAGDAATISAAGLADGLKGKVTLVSPALDPNSTTVEVWVESANPGERLKPGVSVSVGIVANTAAHAIVIPAAALLTATDGGTSVFVLGAGDKPVKQSVKVGIRNGDDAQITDGLKGGARVVTTGAFELSNEDPDVLAKTTIQVQAAKAAGDDDSKDDAK
jgi:HlyD family secretion protein